MISSALGGIASFAIDIISSLGYSGIVFLMTLESMIVPLPSELVMPFAGFLISQGKFSFIGVIVASSIGSLIGSCISYGLGRYGGIVLIKRFGKYLLLNENDLTKAENWFKKSGDKTILISRFVPVVRHIISIPAGIGKMNFKKFTVYTLIGATAWNFILTELGYLLGSNWQVIRNYSEYLSIIVLIGIIVGIIYFIFNHIKK